MEKEGIISKLKYAPFLCSNLKSYKIKDLTKALKNSTFILELDNGDKVAISRWVSAKRTRSYPYARVYDSLCFPGKKITIIPVFKDEGAGGDRDYIQWDTVSLMTLFGVHVIIAYYKSAEINSFSKNKITSQEFDVEHIKSEILRIASYKSNVIDWNKEQLENISSIAKKAIDSYEKISKKLGIKMSSKSAAEERNEIFGDLDKFKKFSRSMAIKAQRREIMTTHKNESVDGSKCSIVIKDFIGGEYYWTCDESKIKDNNIWLIEAKNSTGKGLPSIADIKDGVVKMILFSNIDKVKIGNKDYNPHAMLKITSKDKIDMSKLNKKSKEFIKNLYKEAAHNNFEVKIN